MGIKFWLKAMGVLSIIGGIFGGIGIFLNSLPLNLDFGIMGAFLCFIGGICGCAISAWLVQMLNHAEAQTKLLADIKRQLSDNSKESQEISEISV
ncbi:hypothetical protein [Clostridium sp.]|uniref:hypothetical protein n=1 Tax=Clostridium sp. TaxID=1506 RepID=UPI00283BF53F|nr:hypothetical protein [Clostridium sp.]MDR3594156.1 hypothetical protein [Clostridium sp.]